MQWFTNNEIEANPDKFYLSTSANDKLKICINDNFINSTEREKLRGVKIENNSNFNTQTIFVKAANIVLGHCPFTELPKSRVSMSVFPVSI